jgi:hypothetical protein
VERGTVLAVTTPPVRIIVAVDGDSCAAFELGTPADVAVGHRLRGNLESDLCFALENLSTGEMLDVVPLGGFPSEDAARRALGI